MHPAIQIMYNNVNRRLKAGKPVISEFHLTKLDGSVLHMEPVYTGPEGFLPNAKEATLAKILDIMSQNPVVVVSYVMESWMKAVPKTMPEEEAKKVIKRMDRHGIRNEPDRQSCFLFYHEMLKEVHVELALEKVEGMKKSLLLMKDFDPTVMTGRFSHFFKKAAAFSASNPSGPN